MITRVLFALASLFAVANSSITDCGAGTSLFTITELAMDPPTTVSPGQNVSLTLKYNVPVEVDGGKVLTSLSLNGIPFAPSEGDLCQSAPCPLLPGDHDGSSWYLFPSGVSGKIGTKITWQDNTTGQVYLCINAVLRTAASPWFTWLRGSDEN